MQENIESVLGFLELLKTEMETWAKDLRYRREWEMSDEIYEYKDKISSAINLLENSD